MKLKNTNPPTDWYDAKARIDGLQLARDELQHDISLDAITKSIAAEKQQMFFAGVLYGMALEATKDQPLEARRVF